MRTFPLAIGLCALLSTPAVAVADTFIEGVGGLGMPVAEDDYDDAVDESLKLGVRLGSLGRGGLGGEVAADFTPVNYDAPEISGIDFGVQRYRFQLGGRFGKPIGRDGKLIVFGRATAGLDLVHWSVSGSVLGVDFEDSDTDLGIAAEVAGGVAVNVGSVAIGGQLGVPMAFHFEDDDSNDNDPDLDYTGVDLDLLLTVTAPL